MVDPAANRPVTEVQSISTGTKNAKGKTVFIDNYDSFTYNVVQVRPFHTVSFPVNVV